jgi:hypothetical protein
VKCIGCNKEVVYIKYRTTSLWDHLKIHFDKETVEKLKKEALTKEKVQYF